MGRLDVTEQKLQRSHRSLFISEKREIPAVREQVAGLLSELGYGQRDVFGVRIATEEALLKCDRTKKVNVTYSLDLHRAEITVTDEGPGFDPDGVPDCTAPDNLVKPRGRGITLMRGFMDIVEFGGKGNTVRLVKFNSARGTPPIARGETSAQ